MESNKETILTIEELPDFVASLILQGTDEQRQQFTVSLIETQQQLPSDASSLALFLRCLVAVLRGETPEVEALEAPFTELWYWFENMLNEPIDEARKQEREKHGEAD